MQTASECKSDVRTILTGAEEKIIAEGLEFAGKRGIADYTDALRSIMTKLPRQCVPN